MLLKLEKLLNTYFPLTGLKFFYISASKFQDVVRVEAAFATNKVNSSQLGALVMLCNSDVSAVNPFLIQSCVHL